VELVFSSGRVDKPTALAINEQVDLTALGRDLAQMGIELA
jgi:hypothetical protein